jgi:hypothetical protein
MREMELEAALFDILDLVQQWYAGPTSPRMTGGRFLMLASWGRDGSDHIEEPEMREVIDTFNRARRLIGR